MNKQTREALAMALIDVSVDSPLSDGEQMALSGFLNWGDLLTIADAILTVYEVELKAE